MLIGNSRPGTRFAAFGLLHLMLVAFQLLLHVTLAAAGEFHCADGSITQWIRCNEKNKNEFIYFNAIDIPEAVELGTWSKKRSYGVCPVYTRKRDSTSAASMSELQQATRALQRQARSLAPRDDATARNLVVNPIDNDGSAEGWYNTVGKVKNDFKDPSTHTLTVHGVARYYGKKGWQTKVYACSFEPDDKLDRCVCQ